MPYTVLSMRVFGYALVDRLLCKKGIFIKLEKEINVNSHPNYILI